MMMRATLLMPGVWHKYRHHAKEHGTISGNTQLFCGLSLNYTFLPSVDARLLQDYSRLPPFITGFVKPCLFSHGNIKGRHPKHDPALVFWYTWINQRQ